MPRIISTTNNSAIEIMLAAHTCAICRSTNVTGPLRRRSFQKMVAQVPSPAVHNARYGQGELTPRHSNQLVSRHVTSNARLCHIHSSPQFSSTVA